MSAQFATFTGWVEKVESIVGHSIDVDDDTHGYSLEDAVARYEGGNTPEKYARRVRIKTGCCVRCGQREYHKENMRRGYCSECRDGRER